MTAPPTPAPWWRHAVCYEVYVRSFADADGDGVGDLAGITARLPYLVDLGIDAVWLTPFYRSPQADHGYDVADYRDVDPRFGDLDDFDTLLETAHGLGLKVLVDVVPNHSSDQHAWFRQALAAAPGSRERGRYLFRDGGGPDGAAPPNNWRSVFGGPGWTRVPDGQWYLHLFDPTQPDFDWTHPDVGDEFESVLRFWLDRGADGFRIDVAHGLAKADGLPDLSAEELASDAGQAGDGTDGQDIISLHARPYWDQPAVHEVYRRWRRVLADYPGNRMAIAESWVPDAASMARYIRSDELQQVFNFHWLEADWSAPAMREVLARTLGATGLVGASPTWVLSNHDVVRTVTRYGGGAQGLDRARAAMLAMLALPGSAYLYQGEELGLPQAYVPEADRQDPVWHRGGGIGRDGCRVPLPWTVDGPTYGFSRTEGDGRVAEPWLPQPAGWGDLSVEAQREQAGSTLALVREALHLRRRLLPGLADALTAPDDVPDGAFVVRREGADGPGLTAVVACGPDPVDLARVGVGGLVPLLVSAPDAVVDGVLRADAAAWFAAG